MNKLVIASMEKSAGKTNFIIGLARALGTKIGYMKPFGERLVYQKKRLWDYDSALIAGVMELKESPDEMTIGFEYAKLKYMYDDERRSKKLLAMVETMGKGKDVLLVEGGSNLKCGGGAGLDPISVAKYINGRLYIIISGNEDTIIDNATFLKNHVNLKGVDFGGVIINKVKNVDDFNENYLSSITELGLKVLGVLPYKPELTHLTVNNLNYRLFAKVLTGENLLNRTVKHIFIGAGSAEMALKSTLFQKEDKLIITSGDRSDMIIAAIETNSAGIILTNNIMPQSNIISKASEKNTPLLLVSQDTYQVAKQIESIEPLLAKEDSVRIDILTKLVKEHVDIKKVI
ncbi:MAG: DRTGG domain-containing protein [Candidatus Brocadiia bacterium]